jgi:FixJ family two-component response regulator
VPPPPFIACVDDDAPVREALEGLLRALGFAVEVFASAEDFLQSAPLERISCLILDVKLGGISGLQLQKRLAASGYRIPTIIITAFGDDGLRVQALEAGAVAFLRKPIAREHLLSSIELALNRRPNGEVNP